VNEENSLILYSTVELLKWQHLECRNHDWDREEIRSISKKPFNKLNKYLMWLFLIVNNY